ncbi:4Fe-4S dicluster domain-containing protein [Sedimentibacter saalensis]|jgi:[FeFe] hydrogenase (group B1/B3)|uniref:[FeFe] hydrogenase (Group B1/B3) n=1 Tax=Sedimentibacter saalensis TaxID=130788 RepID=A0A562J104_9FIRM|nr:4Fe-4S dicluster domain-containing protein [Sedimentibacter saalensis]TWH76981.1 [FeFe] hydrogenase (group B1/B3) [Sedimentibacter saalensis]
MKESYVNLINIRRQVFAKIAKMAYDGTDLSELEKSSFEILPGEVALYRDSIFRERAIVDERLRLTLGLDVRKPTDYHRVTDGISEADVDETQFIEPLVNVISFACEACPTKAYNVTDNCRKCLAHPCTNVCPVNAVSIGKDRAIIDQDKCIKCGRCKETCPYSAIVKYERPCAAACGVNAIESDYLGRAKINVDRCVSCGNCIIQCPYGAISDKSQIYQLVKALKNNNHIYAIIAPSFLGQFGPLATPVQIFEGIKQLGFEDVVEVSLGADITTLREAKEFLERVPEEHPYMGTSCCNSWTIMVQKLFPDQYQYISDSASPMVETAKYIKNKDPEAKIAFIGPCISKKLEALREDVKDFVHFVITYEELMGMFVAKGIELSEIEVSKDIQDASTLGRGYAIAGGVAEAVKNTALKIDPSREINVEGASTLHECVKLMRLAKAGKKNGYLLEGMACSGGCIGGPGTIASLNRVRKAVTEFKNQSEYETPFDNDTIDEKLRSK